MIPLGASVIATGMYVAASRRYSTVSVFVSRSSWTRS